MGLQTCLYRVYRVEQKVDGCPSEATCLEDVRWKREGNSRTRARTIRDWPNVGEFEEDIPMSVSKDRPLTCHCNDPGRVAQRSQTRRDHV
jgi:hypothetical protein